MANWTFVKGAVNTNGNGTSASVSLSSPVANGDIIVGFIYMNIIPLPTTITVTDDKSNIYTVVNTVQGSGNSWCSVIYWSNGILTNTPTTVTVNLSSSGPIFITADEFAPAIFNSTLSIDGNATGTGSSSITTNAFNTTINEDLVYCGTFASGYSNFTVGTGFTATEATSANYGTEYLIQTSAGSIMGAWNGTGGSLFTVNALALSAIPPPGPSITGVSPNYGSTAGGTSVTITGINFTGTTSVKFGTTSAASFAINSDTQITAVDPAESSGTVDVTVTTPIATSTISRVDKFTYQAPPIVTVTNKNFISAIFGGRNGAGSISVPGLKVGDKLIWLQSSSYQGGTVQMNTADYFEIKISVNDQIQQLITSDLSTWILNAILIRGSFMSCLPLVAYIYNPIYFYLPNFFNIVYKLSVYF